MLRRETEIEVQGSSMRPLLPPGSWVKVAPCAPREIRRGEIVVFREGRSLVVHRVVAVHQGDPPTFAERGDASPTVRWRPARAVVGRVEGVWLGAGYLCLTRGNGRRVSALLDGGWRVGWAPGSVRRLHHALAERALRWLARRGRRQQVLRWRVVDQVVEVTAPSSALAAQVQATYAGFPTPPEHEAATVRVHTDGSTVQTTGARAHRAGLLGPPWSAWHLRVATNQAVLSALAERHLLPHGSAVRIDGRAALLVGGSGSGKTTLALALHDHGYPLLCEGQVPIDLATGRVQPFPRGLDVVVEARLAPGAGVRGKALRQAPRAGAVEPCPIGWIFFLEQPFPGARPQRLEIGCPAELAPAMRDLLNRAGVLGVDVRTEASLAVVTGDFHPTTTLDLDSLHRQLRASGLAICFVASHPLDRPCFAEPLSIDRPSPARTLLALAANSLNASVDRAESDAPSSVLGQPARRGRAEQPSSVPDQPARRGRAKQQLSDLARLIEGVRVFHFTGGAVAERVRAVEACAGEEEP